MGGARYLGSAVRENEGGIAEDVTCRVRSDRMNRREVTGILLTKGFQLKNKMEIV